MYPPKLPGGGGGVLRLSSDRDDRMGPKINPPPPKSLGPPTKPQKYHAEFLSRSSLSLVEIRSTPLGLNSDYNHKDFQSFSLHSTLSRVKFTSHLTP